eukprot:6197798-Pleurochrysis_carterae.AAC.5
MSLGKVARWFSMRMRDISTNCRASSTLPPLVSTAAEKHTWRGAESSAQQRVTAADISEKSRILTGAFEA